MNVRVLRSAQLDLAAGRDFYERQDAGAGSYFLESIRKGSGVLPAAVKTNVPEAHNYGQGGGCSWDCRPPELKCRFAEGGNGGWKHAAP